LDRWICFDVFFAVAAKVGDGTGCKIHVIANNSRTPTSFEEFWKCAFAGLICSQGSDKGISIKCWHVNGTRDQGRTLHYDWPLVGEEQTLARG
jgi:hypothetical protein